MTESPEPMGLLAELKRRKVVRAGLVYGAGAFAVLQAADLVIGPLGLPTWVMPTLVWLALLGLPATLVVSWFFDASREAEGARPWLPGGGAVVVLVLCGLGLTGWWWRSGGRGGGSGLADAADENAVVVLPFTVLGRLA